MICPTCKSDMIVVEHNKIELDYCTNCQGVWFDSGELELLLESMSLESPEIFLNNILDSAGVESSEKKRKCPICRQKMKKTNIGQEPAILIDVCQQGDGLWFDGGEVGQLIKQLAEKSSEKQGSQHRVVTFLGEVFGAQG
jgi:Zn-finger nucleic acid-binding protein